jgi:hypothetical protein
MAAHFVWLACLARRQINVVQFTLTIGELCILSALVPGAR